MRHSKHGPVSTPCQFPMHRAGLNSADMKGFTSDLQIGEQPFDPAAPAVRQQLLAKLGLAEGTFELITSNIGGLNEGVWYLRTPARASAGTPVQVETEFVLKLVCGKRRISSEPTEAENCCTLLKGHPTIQQDLMLAFPLKIFSCFNSVGVKRYDLLVMRRIRGERVTDIIALGWPKNRASVMHMIEKIGASLYEFQKRYGGIQHGDFQPSNVFFDKDSEEVGFADVGGMGRPTMETDQEHFFASLRLLSKVYGPAFFLESKAAFEKGCARRQAAPGPATPGPAAPGPALAAPPAPPSPCMHVSRGRTGSACIGSVAMQPPMTPPWAHMFNIPVGPAGRESFPHRSFSADSRRRPRPCALSGHARLSLAALDLCAGAHTPSGSRRSSFVGHQRESFSPVNRGSVAIPPQGHDFLRGISTPTWEYLHKSPLTPLSFTRGANSGFGLTIHRMPKTGPWPCLLGGRRPDFQKHHPKGSQSAWRGPAVPCAASCAPMLVA